VVLLRKHDIETGVLKYFEGSTDISERVGHVPQQQEKGTPSQDGRSWEAEGLGAVASGMVSERKGS